MKRHFSLIKKFSVDSKEISLTGEKIDFEAKDYVNFECDELTLKKRRLLTEDDIVGGGGTLSMNPSVGNEPNQSGATIETGVLTLQPADENNPGILVDNDQIIPSGLKQFSDYVATPYGYICGDYINGHFKGEYSSDTEGLRLNASGMRILLDVNGPNGYIVNNGPSHHPYGIYFPARPIYNGNQSIQLKPAHPADYTGNYTIDILPKSGTMMVEDEVTLGPFVMTLNSGTITSSLLRGVLQGTPGNMDGIKLKRAGSIVWCRIPSWEVNTDSGSPNQVIIVPAGSVPVGFRPTLFAAEVTSFVYNNGSITSPNAAIKVTTGGSIVYEYGGSFTNNYGMIDGDFTFSYML